MRIPIILVAVVSTAHVTFGQTVPARPVAQSGQASQPMPFVAPPPASAFPQNSYRGGSLLRASSAQPVLNSTPQGRAASAIGFFAVPPPEPRLFKKHDLISIIIREESQFSSKATTDLKKNADLDAKATAWTSIDIGNFALKGGAIGANPPEVNLSANRNFKGDGTVDRSDSYVQKVQAEVIDVKPNGTLVLQATKKIKTDDEEQTVVLSGACRAEDIDSTNSVLSTQLHDLDVVKTTKGAVRETTKRGLFPRLLDFINPF